MTLLVHGRCDSNAASAFEDNLGSLGTTFQLRVLGGNIPIDDHSVSNAGAAHEAEYAHSIQKDTGNFKFYHTRTSVPSYSSLSATAWYRSTYAGTAMGLVWGLGDPQFTNFAFRLGIDNGSFVDGGRLVASIKNTAGTTIKQYTTNERVFVGGLWRHCAMTYDATLNDGELRVYVDGREATVTKDTDITSGDLSPAAMAPAYYTAGASTGGGFAADTVGAFNDLRFYDETLSAAAISAIHREALGDSGELSTPILAAVAQQAVF